MKAYRYTVETAHLPLDVFSVRITIMLKSGSSELTGSGSIAGSRS